MSEAPPEGWFEKPLGQLAESRRGITYSAAMLEAKEGGLPYVNMKSFMKGGGFNREGTKCFAGLYSTSDLVGERDLLIANTDVTAGDIVGVPALIPEHLVASKVLYSHHVTRLRLNDEVTVPFLYYLLCLPEYRSQMLRIARGTTVLMLDMNAIKRVSICAPKIETTQRRIAEILGTVDEVIEQTEALIAKQQRVKAGLMHDLFTRGVTATGTLRPPPAEAPHLYQDSPLGPIPKEWDAHQIDAIGDVITGNTPAETSLEPGSRGIPFVTPGDVGDDIFVRATERSLTNRNAERARPIPANSVCVVCIGSTIGKLAMVGGESVTNQQINSVICHETALASFIYFSMRHFLPSQLRREAGLQAVPIVNKSTFSRLLIAKPREPGEAAAIQSRLLAASAAIQAETAHLAKLRQQKQGLMHDLLTGRVPVAI